MSKFSLAVVISVFNEEESLLHFNKSLTEVLENYDKNYQILYINDGSTDNSRNLLSGIATDNSKVRVIEFSRNFGHEAAMLAGIDNADADAIICMDSDLQHPPSLIPAMVNKYKSGFDIVNMIRVKRKDGGAQKNLFSGMFYSLINSLTKTKLEPNASDFFLVSSRIADLLRTDYREQARFLRGIIQMIGFPKTNIDFVAPARFKGKTKYSFIKLLLFSFSAISVLSKAPLRIGVFTGLFFAFLSIIVLVYSLVMKFLEQPVAGYTTLVILITSLFSIQFFVLGIIGEYIGYVFDEVKKRPHYIIMNDSNSNKK